MSLTEALAQGRAAWRHRGRRNRFDVIAESLGLTGEWTVVPTEGDTLVAMDADRVVKAALSATSAHGLQHHRRMIHRLQLVGVGHLAPRVLDHGRAGDHDYVIETRCAGRPLPRSTEPDMIATATRAVSTLHDATATRVSIDDAVFQQLVGRHLDRLASDSRLPVPRAAVETLGRALADSLVGSRVTLATVHGDHWHANVIAEHHPHETPRPGSPHSPRLVDWENGAVLGLPEFDHVHFLLALHHNGPAAARNGWHAEPATIGDWLGRHVDWLADETPNPHLPAIPVVVATWLHHVAGGLARASRYRMSARWIRTQVAPLFAPDVTAAVQGAASNEQGRDLPTGARR